MRGEGGGRNEREVGREGDSEKGVFAGGWEVNRKKYDRCQRHAEMEGVAFQGRD